MAKKKPSISLQTKVIVFYTAFFIWLISLIFLTPDASFMTYFTGGIAIFYFVFLRSAGDLAWFLLGASFIYAAAIVNIDGFSTNLDFSAVYGVPIWLPVAWGTTVLALRRFYQIVNVAKL